MKGRGEMKCMDELRQRMRLQALARMDRGVRLEIVVVG